MGSSEASTDSVMRIDMRVSCEGRHVEFWEDLGFYSNQMEFFPTGGRYAGFLELIMNIM
jgi:hypothetical protein